MERFALLSYIKRISGWRYGSWPVGMILLSGVILTVLYFAVLSPFWDKKKAEISAQLSERFQARIHFTGLGIGLFNGDVHVKGVSIESGALVLEVKDLVLRLALGEFIKTRNLQKSLREIALDEPVVSFRKPESSDPKAEQPKNWRWSLEALEDFFKVNSQIIFSIKNGAVLIPGDRLAIPTLVAGFDYLGAGEVRLGVHLEYLEKEIHFNGALKNSLRDLSGKLQVLKDQSPVDAFTVQGNLDEGGIRLTAKSEMRDMNLAWNYLPSKKEQNFVYAHQNVTLGYFLSWLGWDSLVREEKLRWFLAQAHLGVLGDKTVSGVRVDFVEKETDGKSLQYFSTDFRLRDLHSGESAAWILQKRNGLPTRWNGSYFGNGGALRAWGLQEEASERMTGSIELENFLFGQIPLSARLTFQSISNGSEWTLYHAPDSGEGAYEKSLTARVTRSTNGALEVVVPHSPAGLELSLVMSADQKKIESFESKMDQFHLRIPADFLGLPFLRDGMVSGRLRLVRENQKAARFESTLSLSHAVTQEKWLSSRLSVEKGQLDIQELAVSLGKDKLLVHGGADFAASDGQLRLAYQYGGNTGIFSGRVKNKDGVFSLNFENQEGLEKASVVYKNADKNLQVNLSKLHFGADRLLSVNGLWSVEGGIRGKGKIALEGMNPWDKSGRLDADYEALYPQIELPRIQYKDDQNTLFGYGQIRLGSKIVYEMNLGDTKDKATLNLSGESTGQDNKATLVVHNLDPTHYKSPIQGFVKGRLRLLATATGSFADPHLTVRGFLDDFRIRGQAANLFTEVIKVGSEWEIRRFEVTRQGKNGRDTLLQVNRGRYHQRKIEVDFQLTDYPLLWATRGNFFFSYDLDENRGFFQSPEYSLDGKPGTLFYTAFERVSEKPGTVQWLLRSPTRNGLSGFVTEKAENDLTGKKSASYFLKLAYDQDKTNFARLEGSASKNKLDLVFTTDHFRVSQLNALAPIVQSEESKGETFQIDYKGRTISGVNMFLALTGTPSKPLLNGKLLASGKIRLIGQGGQAEPFRALVEVEDNVFRFKEALLKFDGGSQFALEGNIAARGLKSVDEFDLHLLSRGPTGIPLAYNGSFFETRGRAQMDVTLSGTMFYPKVTGKLKLVDNEVNFEKKGSTAQTAESWEEKRLRFFNRIEWDVEMEAGAKNRLNSAIFELSLETNSKIRFAGTLYNDSYSLSGAVFSRSGTYTHSGVDFRVKNVTLTFPKGESGANPYVDMEAITRVRDSEVKENVDVTLEKKSRLNDLQAVTFRSAPPRKPEEIRSLLGYSDGRANNNNTAEVNKAIGVSSRLVANTLFFRPLERTIRKSLSLDYFHIDTDILALANQVNVGSSNYVPQSFTTTVSMGKYLGENFFIQSDLNLGLGGQTNTIGGSIGLEYDLKLFSLGTKFEILDFSQIQNGKNPFDLSFRLNKNWSF